MQTATLGASKVLILIGAGVTGSVVLGNGRIGDLFSDLSKVVLKYVKEDKDGTAEGGAGESTAILTKQIERLTRELRQLAASRPITVVNGPGQSSGTSIASLAVPVVVIGAAGYGYMWWKGITLSSIMYVTRNQMNSAVATVSKQLTQFSEALSVAKKHLTSRLDFMSKRLDESISVQSVIKDQVSEVLCKVEDVGAEMQTVQQIVQGLEVRITDIQGKQDFGNRGIVLLCQFAQRSMEGGQGPRFVMGGAEGPPLLVDSSDKPHVLMEGGCTPQLLEDIKTFSSMRLERAASSPAIPNMSGLKELQFISDHLAPSVGNTDKIDFNAAVETPVRHHLPRSFQFLRPVMSMPRT